MYRTYQLQNIHSAYNNDRTTILASCVQKNQDREKAQFIKNPDETSPHHYHLPIHKWGRLKPSKGKIPHSEELVKLLLDYHEKE